MTARAKVKQADVARVVRGAIRGGLPVGSFKIVVEGGRVEVLPLAANAPSDDAAEMERRMRGAFGE
jgi:hypothetical protein